MERTLTSAVTGINLAEYQRARSDDLHVFLVGDLKRPTTYPFVRDLRLEIIVCNYRSGDDGRYHWHPTVTEYEIVTEGEIEYFDVASGRTRCFAVGDLSVIPPKVCVRRLVRARATTIAVKVPSSAEKVHCASCGRDCAYRMDPFEEPR